MDCSLELRVAAVAEAAGLHDLGEIHHHDQPQQVKSYATCRLKRAHLLAQLQTKHLLS